MLRNSAPERAGEAKTESWSAGLRSADIKSRGSSSCRTGFRAKGGFFGFVRSGDCARDAGLAEVLRVESLERRDRVVPTGEDRIGSVRAGVFAAFSAASVALAVAPSDFVDGVWTCERAGAAFAAPPDFPMRLTPDA